MRNYLTSQLDMNSNNYLTPVVFLFLHRRNFCGVKVLDCNLEVNEYEIQLHDFVHFRTYTFGKGLKPILTPSMSWIVSMLFFYKDFWYVFKERNRRKQTMLYQQHNKNNILLMKSGERGVITFVDITSMV